MIQLGYKPNGSRCEILLACGPTDLRKGFAGLSGLVKSELAEDPLSSKIFIFCNRSKDTVKIFFYHDGGVWVCAKRLERGSFKWPDRGNRSVRITPEDLEKLLSGIDFIPMRFRDKWLGELRSNRNVTGINRSVSSPANAVNNSNYVSTQAR